MRKLALTFCGLLVAGVAIAALPPRQAAAPAATRLDVRGQPAFLVGVNYPWRSPQDFGTGAWGHAGASQPTTYAEIDTDFANLAAQGVRVVKWRVFNDGRYSPEFDGRGFVTGLDEKFFDDLDAAVELARRHDLYLIFSLFSSGFWTTSCAGPAGVQFGGHRDVLLNPLKRRSLIANAIVPMVRHLGQDDRVLAYEIIAEPDWGIQQLHPTPDWRIKVPLGSVRALVAEVARAIHAYSPALATVETNRASHLPAWRGLGLDFYSFSWYDWLEPYDPLDTAAQVFGLDRPVVLGEFPASQSAWYDLGEVLDIAIQRGYAGAFAWSYWGGDQHGRWAAAIGDYLGWARDHWPSVSLGAAAEPPAEPPAPQPPPFGYDQLQLDVSQGSLVVHLDVAAREPGQYQAKLYLRPVGEAERAERLISIAGGKPQAVIARFEVPRAGVPYQLSLGLFDRDWHLLKWYEWVASFVVEDGQVREPPQGEREREDPCATPS